jgi:hypothetical protein
MVQPGPVARPDVIRYVLIYFFFFFEYYLFSYTHPEKDL